MLKTIGTTGKQLKKIVKIQANLLSLIGIPIGLILGATTGTLLLPSIMKIFNTTSINDNSAVLSPAIFIFSALFAWLTVRISCSKPCKIAEAVTPIEALRVNEGDDESQKKKSNNNKKTAKVTPMSLAIGNIKRNRKRIIIVVMSLSLGLILLNSIYGLISGFDMEMYIADMSISDYMVTDYTITQTSINISEKNLNGITQDFLDELNEMDGLKAVSNVYASDYEHLFSDSDWKKIEKNVFSSDIFLNSIEVQMFSRLSGTSIDSWIKQQKKTSKLDGITYGIGEIAFRNLDVLSGSLNWKEFQTGKYVIAGYFEDNDTEEKVAYFHPGDTVTVISDNGKQKEYRVMAVAEMPTSASTQYSMLFSCNFILPESEYIKLYGESQPMSTLFNVQDGKTDEFDSWIDSYCTSVNPELSYVSRATLTKDFESFILMFNLIGGVIIFILMLIGLLNFTNTMFTSVIIRKRELAMLEAVGMTSSQQKKMLIYEGCFYSVVTSAVSLILGGLINLTLIRSFGKTFFFFAWKFTILPIAVCIPIMLILSALIPMICYVRMQKISVVERMKVQD